MRKNTLHTIINLVGLTVALSCSLFISLIIYRHFTFDDFHINKDYIYKVYDYQIGPGGTELGTSMPYPLTQALLTENIGIERATSILTTGKLIRYEGKTLDMSTSLVDPDFLSIFSFPVVRGNKFNPLSSMSDAVVTESTAQKLFSKDEPVGKRVEVKLNGKWYPLTVTAVVKDFPENSTLKFSVLARTELFPHYPEMRNLWDSRNHPVYIQLAPGTSMQQAEIRLRNLVGKYLPMAIDRKQQNGYLPDKNGHYYSLRLLPFSEEHFSPNLGNSSTVSKPFLFVLMMICGVILMIASFNFVNLNIGLSFTRAKEIGVRKCLGADKKQIWLQVFGESFLMVFFSMMLSILLVIMMIGRFNQIFSAKMNAVVFVSPPFLLIFASLLFVVTLVSSGYPSTVLAKLKVVEILKGKVSIKKPGGLRNALIVTQFTIAIVLMCSTVIIFQQFDHLRSAPLGYSTESVISIPLKNDDRGKDIVSQLRSRLSTQTSVVSVSGSDVNLGVGNDGTTSTSVICFTYGDKNICGQVMNADYDILKTLGIDPVDGRDFSAKYARDTSEQVIVTESYAAQFGARQVAGFRFYIDSTEPPVQIVGIIPDIQIKSLGDLQKPITIFLNRGDRMGYTFVKVRTRNPAATMDLVKTAYASIEPGVEFNASYASENVERLYREEKMMGRLLTIGSAVAIILSCMGLFGLASIIIRQKVKEIGVRKVLGASVISIFALVAREFLKPVVVAFLIAVPLCWWMMDSWLQHYTYRVQIHWWIFLTAGVVSVFVTLCTIGFQSVKAATVNPANSLRSE